MSKKYKKRNTIQNAKEPAQKSSKVKEINQEKNLMLSNGLADVLDLNDTAYGCGPGFKTSQLSQIETLYKNNRWYLISNGRQLLSQTYVEHGLIQAVVDVPVDDGFRGGVDITSSQLDEKNIKLLKSFMEAEDDIGEIVQANKWKRLFGGSAIIMISEQDPETKLDMNLIDEDSIIEFRAVDLWEITDQCYDVVKEERYTQTDESHRDSDIDNEGVDEGLETPKELEVSDPTESVMVDKLHLVTEDSADKFYYYYGQKIHYTRVRIMKGMKAPSFIEPRLRGWGVSVVEPLIRSINQYLKSTDLTFEVLDEFKLDIFKIKGLANALQSPAGEASIRRRVALANQQKNYQNALSMDSEDDYDHKQLSFAGLAEVMTGVRMQIASDVKMPLTKVFGISAAGFSSGEDDIENYNAMVESTVRSKSKFDIMWLIKIRCKQLFGFVPADLEIEFKPLRVLSTVDEEKVKDSQFLRALQAAQAGYMTAKEFKESCNKNNLVGVKLDTSIDKLDMTGNEMGDESETEIEDRRSEEGFQRQSEMQDKAAEQNAKDEKKPKLANSREARWWNELFKGEA